MRYYLFARFFQYKPVEFLLDTCEKLGIDGPTALVREGFSLTDENLAQALPAYVAASQRRGLLVEYADTSIPMARIEAYEEEIRILKANGIKQFRLNHVPKSEPGSPRQCAAYVRGLAQRTEALLQKIGGIQGVVQIHGGCYPHNATGAYEMVQGLDPACIGVKVDPGNNIGQEGTEVFSYQIPLLGSYIAALSGKDACYVRGENHNTPTNGWQTQFIPSGEGPTDFAAIFSLLKQQHFAGPVILMPFYSPDDLDAQISGLQGEVTYLKAMQNKAGIE